MDSIVDRRLNGRNKSAVNRARFVRRYKSQIKEAVADAINRRSIKDFERGERIKLPRKAIAEPQFELGPGGRRETVHPGNREFIAGDRLPRPNSGTGATGSAAADEGSGEDDFSFVLSREEFLDYFFDDLALPNLLKTQLANLPEFTRRRAGYTNTGVPTNINIVRSLRSAAMRRRVLQAPYRARLRVLDDIDAAPPPVLSRSEQARRDTERAQLRRKISAVPFIDTFDLKYNYHANQPRPTSQAVMFCLMDVSGSMDQTRKDLAKRFFALLYMFLTRKYERLEVVFIRHHTQASEVAEADFFAARDTGGTIVSSALRLMDEIICARYPTNAWNIYGAQASDGDNWHTDSAHCATLLRDQLLPKSQYFAYVQVGSGEEQGLWQSYAEIAAENPRLAVKKVLEASEIYPVFRELFSKEQH